MPAEAGNGAPAGVDGRTGQVMARPGQGVAAGGAKPPRGGFVSGSPRPDRKAQNAENVKSGRLMEIGPGFSLRASRRLGRIWRRGRS
ncbi:hypothetical protein [Methylocella sp.]|uniref:hypothetical protein n=1 Tax=Methylocella sp. TaxID=1978226 RepID=UPI003784B457